MSDSKRNLLNFFDRPTEPCFMPKGENGVGFDIPEHYYPDKYKSLTRTLSNRFGGGNTITVGNIALPDLTVPKRLAYNAQFSLFIPSHRQMAAKLIDIFMNMRDVDDLLSLCSYCQLHINPYMFNYCLSVAILHRHDTKGLDIPTFAETFPDKFMDPKVFRRARERSNFAAVDRAGVDAETPITIPFNYTASPLEPEQRVAYFREDIGVNLHHWHWHLVYPHDSADRSIVAKDRRGELFYYMHQQIINRYNVERLCNNLKRVKRYNNFNSPIEEGYFPKMDSRVASRAWPPRFPNSKLQDIVRPVEKIRIDVYQMERWRDHILEAIRKMAVLRPNGREVPLKEDTGIDVLGNMIEASLLSPNKDYYGDFHNTGHVFFSYCHDPDNRHLELHGVMGDSATAMRDPVFFRWHSYINDIFTMYKSKLTPYTADRLEFPGINVMAINIVGGGERNTFSTYWEQSTMELGRGLDFAPRGSVLARFTHLQHEEFEYAIEVNNTSGQSKKGTVRIFIAPQVDESGQPLNFDAQRKFMIELDKFTHEFQPGYNNVRRSSVDSSVTIPYERVFRNQNNRPGEPTATKSDAFNFCGCGWPHHMLIPKGTVEGYPMLLYVMVSNWANDRVVQNTDGTCDDAASYCGIRDRKYPDRQPMGFPFDRPVPNADTIADFLRHNMAVRNCTVIHTDTTSIRGHK